MTSSKPPLLSATISSVIPPPEFDWGHLGSADMSMRVGFGMAPWTFTTPLTPAAGGLGAEAAEPVPAAPPARQAVRTTVMAMVKRTLIRKCPPGYGANPQNQPCPLSVLRCAF